jgi:hypothetical protein
MLFMKFSFQPRSRRERLMDINDNAVGLVVGFIIRGITAIRAERNTERVTL